MNQKQMTVGTLSCWHRVVVAGTLSMTWHDGIMVIVICNNGQS